MSAGRLGDRVDPGAARQAAQHILSDRRFRAASTPRPLRGPLHWLGDRVESVFGPIGRFLGDLSGWVWLGAGALVVAAIVWAIVRGRARRIAAAAKGPRPARAVETGDDADALERAADEAERDGDLERAVRLRFRAGLVRLGDRGAIRYRPSVTTGEVRRALTSERFDGLAGTFEAVTYGGRPADEPDVAAARSEWPRVLDEAGRR